MKFKNIGVITKPQGLKGEFRLKTNINAALINEIGSIVFNDETYCVLKAVQRAGFVIIKVKEVDVIEQAEKLRGKQVYMDFSNALNKDLFYNEKIVGMKAVFENGAVVGEIVEINNYGASDVCTVLTDNNKEILFALIDGVITKVDFNNKKVVLSSEKFNEVKA